MKLGFYPKLAFEGIRKNKRMYVPYILTCVGMVMMTYIINYLKESDAVEALTGGTTIRTILNIGNFVLAFFSAIFLFYTNSFLIRRRKKEFGLYNILGMGKGNLGRILLCESLFVALFAMTAGMIGGIAISKLAELGLVNLLHGSVTYTLSVSISGILFTAAIFGVIFCLLFLNALRQVWFSSAISLIRSENTGEKPPKANWLFGILGVVIVGIAYYLAVTIQDPLSAIVVFFIAVLMVIGGTYLVMIAGSVLFCRILQKKKNYYYKSSHFVSVSSMVYRMKRNGAGLASICILATMVLVMISSTMALFIGSEEVIYNRYPREINAKFYFECVEDFTKENVTLLKNNIETVLKEKNAIQENMVAYRTASIAGLLHEGDVIFDSSDINDFNLNTYSDLFQIYLIPIEDYNAMSGKNVSLNPDEVLVYSYHGTFEGDFFGFQDVNRYTVKEYLEDCFVSGDMAMLMTPSLVVIVPDIGKAIKGLEDSDGNQMTNLKWMCDFDISLGVDAQKSVAADLKKTFREFEKSGMCQYFSFESREANREDFYSMFGGLFYLGIVLSIVFVFAAVLIIYYKQVSEGYEDQSRFEIMQKVGMTKRDIRKSINSQMLTVFFLPLLGAGMHLAFAFPIIEKLLLVFNLNNHTLFVCTTISSFLVFTLFYVVVYRITSNAYYHIVSEAGRIEKVG